MKIDVSDVLHVAGLARLKISEDDAERLNRELSGILTYMEKLGELDAEGVIPMAHALSLDTPYREDKVKPSLDPEKALENAPEKSGGFFQVPKVV